MSDTESSVSRQHFIDTGHYGDRATATGWLDCARCDADNEAEAAEAHRRRMGHDRPIGERRGRALDS